jgi:signal transduction histidine kinase
MKNPESPLESSIQPLVIGTRGDDFANELTAALGKRARSPVILDTKQWQTPYLQSFRSPGELWALLIHDPKHGMGIEEMVRCVQSIDLTLRPNRLYVLTGFLRENEALGLLQAGCDGFLPMDITAKEVVAEFEKPRTDANDIVTNPYRWLHTLSRAAEELHAGFERELQLKKLLKIFGSELRVDRSSILLLEGEKLRLAAGFGMPPGLEPGTLLEIKPDSISAWVIRNKRARLVEGHLAVVNDQVRSVHSAVCAPLISENEVLGVVNFSALEEGRRLLPADMAAADVFASMIAFAIANRQLHERAVENERLAAVGQTMSSVSHCMKNLLTIFRGTTDILARAVQKQDFAQVSSAYELLERGTRRLDNTVMDLLDFAKKRPPQLGPVEPAQLLGDLCESYFTPAVRRTHSYTIECSAAGSFLLDEFRLQRALANLLSNAVEATHRGGRLRVAAVVEGQNLRFSVADDGPGVPPEKLEEIFTPFFSTKGSTGTGLGLAMVSKFAEENGGTVEANNDTELGGLCVSIVLPIRKD